MSELKREETKKIELLEKEVVRLYKKVHRLEQRLAQKDKTVLSVLRQRGLQIVQYNPIHGLLLPSDADADAEGCFFELMRRYSFRLFLRDLISHQEHLRIQDLTRFCSLKTALNYLQALQEMGIVLGSEGDTYALTAGHITSLGPTLEWFTAQLFIRHFDASAVYGVKFIETKYGGDYDVIAWLGERLAYVEVKSSPPKGVEVADVRSFLYRLDDLTPNVAFFLVDTELRMKDKIVPLFEEEIRRIQYEKGRIPVPVIRLAEELFHINNSLFIMNSKKGIGRNFRICLRHFSASRSHYA